MASAIDDSSTAMRYEGTAGLLTGDTLVDVILRGGIRVAPNRGDGQAVGKCSS